MTLWLFFENIKYTPKIIIFLSLSIRKEYAIGSESYQREEVQSCFAQGQIASLPQRDLQYSEQICFKTFAKIMSSGIFINFPDRHISAQRQVSGSPQVTCTVSQLCDSAVVQTGFCKVCDELKNYSCPGSLPMQVKSHPSEDPANNHLMTRLFQIA